MKELLYNIKRSRSSKEAQIIADMIDNAIPTDEYVFDPTEAYIGYDNRYYINDINDRNERFISKVNSGGGHIISIDDATKTISFGRLLEQELVEQFLFNKIEYNREFFESRKEVLLILVEEALKISYNLNGYKIR